jgi:hypothetical protein
MIPNNQHFDIDEQREAVQDSFKAAISTNKMRYGRDDPHATEEYIYPNQDIDAHKIIEHFYDNKCRVVSVQKKTKVGADGLMLRVAQLMTQHPDDDFILDYLNIRIITGMSNTAWECNIKEGAPQCFKDIIFHHGKLNKANLAGINNSLIIIDEIDSGSNESQKLDGILKDAGVLDVDSMKEHNNRFLFISATMISQQWDMYRWGNLHVSVKMTIPPSYIGHKDFLERGVIKEFYALNTVDKAKKWIDEDVKPYGTDFRVHIVRVTNKTIDKVRDACISEGIKYHNHTSKDRLTGEDEHKLFIAPLENHAVLLIKGLFRRATLIPNAWKLRIGATHEQWRPAPDDSVQVQGLPGRMCGFWRSTIENGHRIGPYRTHIKGIKDYEKKWDDPFGEGDYHTSGFVMKKCRVNKKHTMLSPHNVNILHPIPFPDISRSTKKIDKEIFKTQDEVQIFYKQMKNKKIFKGTRFNIIGRKKDDRGFYLNHIRGITRVMNKEDIMDLGEGWGVDKIKKKPRLHICYSDKNDINTIQYIVCYYS